MEGKTAYTSGATPGPPGGHAPEHPVRCSRLSCSLRRGALIGSCVWRCALTGHNVLQIVHHRSGILYCNVKRRNTMGALVVPLIQHPLKQMSIVMFAEKKKCFVDV